jgi:hypothetical protein
MVASRGRLLRRARSTPILAVVLVVALVAAVVVLGEPSRPATATVVRPVVTVPSLCSAPTVVDVAARDATRGLTAVGALLGLDDELIGEPARDLRIVDTEAGAFFVLVRDGELRVAALSPAGLPIVNTDEEPPQTYRAFGLGQLTGRPSHVIGGPAGVFVLFGGDDPAEVFALTPTTLAASSEVKVARDPDGPVIADPESRAGSAVVHEGVLWLAGDDGRVVTFDPLADGEDRWTERAEGLVAPLIAQGEDRVHGLFETTAESASLEVRSFASEGDPTVTPVEASILDVTGVTYPSSIRPAFAVTTPAGAALLRPADADTSVVTIPASGGELLGLAATEAAAALVTADDGHLAYEILDRTGASAGTFGGPGTAGRCVVGPWPDAASVLEPLSEGTLLHLHDPSSPWDCVVDTRDAAALAELTERCQPGGAWSVDKGSAPARDFTVEIGRALDEVEADEFEREDVAEPEEGTTTAEAIQEELSEAGLGVVETEVDPEAADECAVEEVTAVPAPVIDLAEPVGARAIRVEWSWNGGSCLPGGYLVTRCLLGDAGSECSDTTEHEVVANPTSGRSSLELPARPDRTYRVSVRAVKGTVVSDPSGALLVTTPAVTPDPPVAVSGTLQDGTWQLAWSSCLSGGDCDQRPDGFLVTVEGCGGEGLGQVRRRFDVTQRGTSFGADGAGFGDVDLLGRRVQFRVATTHGERVSEPVAAGGCTRSVRPGRDTAASNVTVSLTGRAREVTLAPIARSRQLSELFGRTDYDSVRARLVRGAATFSGSGDVLSAPVTFGVEVCTGAGWTVELTPRKGGEDLTRHRTRLTDAVVACNPSIVGDTRFSTRVAGASSSGIDVRVAIEGLRQDTRNGVVSGVSATAACARAFGGTDELRLSGGAVSSETPSDEVAFTMPVPVILALREGCTIAPVVAFQGGGSAALAPRTIDLGPAGDVIVQAVLPVVVRRLDAARTAAYEQRSGIAGVGREDVVAVRHGNSGVPCSTSPDGSRWEFTVSGPRHADCGRDVHEVAFGESDLDDAGRGQITVEVRLGGLKGLGSQKASASQTLDVCGMPSGDPPDSSPCAPDPEPCPYDPSIPEDDPACFEPCSHDPDLPADDPACQPCPTDPSLPATDPACTTEPDPPPDGGETDGGETVGGETDGGETDGGDPPP